MIVHTCRLGRYVRTLRPPMPMGTVAPQVRFVKICQDGSLVVYVERFSYEEKVIIPNNELFSRDIPEVNVILTSVC